MRAPRAKKPTSVDEVTRVLRIYDLLADEMTRRLIPKMADGSGLIVNADTTITWGPVRFDVLSVAERIAARTDDGDPA